jgi:hypothetical protein
MAFAEREVGTAAPDRIQCLNFESRTQEGLGRGIIGRPALRQGRIAVRQEHHERVRPRAAAEKLQGLDDGTVAGIRFQDSRDGLEETLEALVPLRGQESRPGRSRDS